MDEQKPHPMDDLKPHPHIRPDGYHVPKDERPYWRRAHHDWRFWVAVVLMLAAITTYVLSIDLSLRPPGTPLPPAIPTTRG